MTQEPIRHTNECAQDPQSPRVSTQRGEKWKVVVKVEYFLILTDSTEFASQLAPLEEVDTLDGARVSEQVGKPPRDQRHAIRPLTIITTYTHRLQNSRYTPRYQSTMNSFINSSMPGNTATTTPARQTMSTKNINISTTNTCMFNNNAWEHQDVNQELSLETHYPAWYSDEATDRLQVCKSITNRCNLLTITISPFAVVQNLPLVKWASKIKFLILIC